jgi:TPR repeat protein
MINSGQTAGNGRRMTEIDVTDAFELYQKDKYAEALPKLLDLESRGSLEAKFCLGYMYQEGLGVSKDYDEALARYRDLSEAGAPLGSFYAGATLERQKRFSECIEYYRIGAQQNNVSSAYALYRLSKNNIANISESDAAKYFQQAIDGGHLYAQRDLAHLMLRGKYGVSGFFRAMPLFISGFINMAKITANDPKNPKLY